MKHFFLLPMFPHTKDPYRSVDVDSNGKEKVREEYILLPSNHSEDLLPSCSKNEIQLGLGA